MANHANVDAEIAAKEQELEQLKAQRGEQGKQEYPKMIEMPGDPEKRLVVHSKEQEAAHRGEVVQAFDLTPEEQEAKRLARAEADKEAAGAKSRLAGASNVGPENPEGKSAKKSAPKKAEKPGVLSRAKSAVLRKK